jgi:hypothetical protein
MIDKKLKVLFNMLDTCVSQDIISLTLANSVKRDATANKQYISFYINMIEYYTKLWASYND